MGAHPAAPSSALVGDEWRPLDALIRQSPRRYLGEPAASRCGELPFLFKVLAADEPLSLQAHPTKEQAEAGFATEDAQGIPLTAHARTYRDRNHKPELLCALSPFEALCGFRPIPEIRRVLAALGSDRENAALAPLMDDSAGQAELRRAVGALLHAGGPDRAALVQSIRSALRDRRRDTPFEPAFVWTENLAARYPHDAGVVISLLMNYVRLAPGEALYQAPGVLHSYLRGTAVELMASSDNVLRGGLTSKHVDADALLQIVAFDTGVPEAIRCLPSEARQCVYRTPAAEFELWRLSPGAEDMRAPRSAGPEILLVIEGAITCRTAQQTIHLRQGESAFVPAYDDEYSLAGPAVVYRATVPGGMSTM